MRRQHLKCCGCRLPLNHFIAFSWPCSLAASESTGPGCAFSTLQLLLHLQNGFRISEVDSQFL